MNMYSGSFVVLIAAFLKDVRSQACSDTPDHYFPFGLSAGDTSLPAGQTYVEFDVIPPINITGKLLDKHVELWASMVLDFNPIAVTLNFEDLSAVDESGNYQWHRLVNGSDSTLTSMSLVVSRAFDLSFEGTTGLVATWQCRSLQYGGGEKSAQIGIVSDGSLAYLIMNIHPSSILDNTQVWYSSNYAGDADFLTGKNQTGTNACQDYQFVFLLQNMDRPVIIEPASPNCDRAEPTTESAATSPYPVTATEPPSIAEHAETAPALQDQTTDSATSPDLDTDECESAASSPNLVSGTVLCLVLLTSHVINARFQHVL